MSKSKNARKRIKRQRTQADLLMARAGIIPFDDPVAAIASQIHARSYSARSPKMFDLVDRLPYGLEDWQGAAHEAGIALGQHAGISHLAKRCESMWNLSRPNWLKSSITPD